MRHPVNYSRAFSCDAIGQVIADQADEVSSEAARLNEQLTYGFNKSGNLARQWPS